MGARCDGFFVLTATTLDIRRFPFLFAHRAFIPAEILALAAAPILPFLRGAPDFAAEGCPPMIRLSSLSRLSIFSRIATACLSCWSDMSARGLDCMRIQ